MCYNEPLDAQAFERNPILKPSLDFVKEIAVNAGSILKKFPREDLNIAYKSYKDLVTQADFASERYLIDTIQASFPEHGIFAEESGQSAGLKAHQWFIDPLDGTLNYAYGVPFYSVSVGYALEGEMQLGAVYDPGRGELFSAARGQGATLNGTPIRAAQRTRFTPSRKIRWMKMWLIFCFSTVRRSPYADWDRLRWTWRMWPRGGWMA